MEFDDRLDRALDVLAERLRDEIAAQLVAVRSDVVASILAEREQAKSDRETAVTNATREARELAEQEFSQRLTAQLAAARSEIEAQTRAAVERQFSQQLADQLAAARSETHTQTRATAEREFNERLADQLAAARSEAHAETRATAEREFSQLLADQLAAARTVTQQETRANAEREFSQLLADRVAAAKSETRAEVTSGETAATDRMVQSIRALDGVGSLSDSLDVLIEAAAKEAGRAAIFLPQGSVLNGWRSIGFERIPSDGHGFSLSRADAGMIAQASDTGHVVGLDQGSARAALLPAFTDLADEAAALAVPLMMAGQVFAVLYVDEGTTARAARRSWPSTVEVLARHAARTLEATTAAKLVQAGEVLVS